MVVDTHGRTPAGARVLDASAPTWVATADELRHATPPARWTSRHLLRALHAKGRGLVLLEGGPTLAGAFVRGRRWSTAVVGLPGARCCSAPAPPRWPGTGISTLADGVPLEVTDVTRAAARTCGVSPAGPPTTAQES